MNEYRRRINEEETKILKRLRATGLFVVVAGLLFLAKVYSLSPTSVTEEPKYFYMTGLVLLFIGLALVQTARLFLYKVQRFRFEAIGCLLITASLLVFCVLILGVPFAKLAWLIGMVLISAYGLYVSGKYSG